MKNLNKLLVTLTLVIASACGSETPVETSAPAAPVTDASFQGTSAPIPTSNVSGNLGAITGKWEAPVAEVDGVSIKDTYEFSDFTFKVFRACTLKGRTETASSFSYTLPENGSTATNALRTHGGSAQTILMPNGFLKFKECRASVTRGLYTYTITGPTATLAGPSRTLILNRVQ